MNPRRAALSLPAAILAAVLTIPLLSACGPPAASSSLRVGSYAHPVPPGVTFDLAQGREITPARMQTLLKRTRLLFVGEHHGEPRSHRFQVEILKLLRAQGREITLALEMFPPSANGALEAWRQGRITDEGEFLERSGWYQSWGFPWAYYRELFQFIRRHRLPTVGINAEKATRAAARKVDLSTLPQALQNEIGPLQPSPEAQGFYLLDALRAAGHGDGLEEASPGFMSYRRVQWLWERLMGLRAVRLAEAGEKNGIMGSKIVVMLIGSGHLAHGLGANLQAARAGDVPQLTIWDDVREKSPDRRYPVPVGMADLVRIYEQQPGQRGWPSMAGVKLEKNAQGAGVKVKTVRGRPGSPLRKLKPGDVITVLNHETITSPARLRLAYEMLGVGGTAWFELTREGKELTVKILVPEPAAEF